MTINKRTILYYLLLSFLFGSSFQAQIDTAWTKTFNYGSNDRGLNVIETSDSSYLITATSQSSSDVKISVMIKTDLFGNVKWEKEFPVLEYGRFTDLVKSNDNNFYLIGSTFNFVKLHKIDLEGNIVWSKVIDRLDTIPDTVYIAFEDSSFSPAQLQLSEDNGVYLLGKSGDLETRIWTAKITPSGELEWANSFSTWSMLDGGDLNFIRSIDGFFIQSNDGTNEVIFYRTDNVGNLIDGKRYRPTNVHSQSFKSIAYYDENLPDSGYVLVGEQMGDLAMLRVDNEANVWWSKTYERYTSSMNFGNKVIDTPNGGFVLIGGTGDNQNPKLFIIQTNRDGDIKWKKVYSNSYGEHIENTTDNGFIACGTKAKKDIYLLKLESAPLSIISGDKNWIDPDWDGMEEVQLDGSQSYSPNGFSIVEYTWMIGDDVVGNNNTINLTLPTGSTVVKLKVKDESGVSGENSFTVNVCSYRLETAGSITSAISTINDSIFFASSTDDQIYCFDNINNHKWTLATGGDIQSTTTIGPKGHIYVGSADTRLYCFDQLGNFKWDTPMGGIVSASPAITQEGTIYVGTENNRLYSVDGDDGSINWNYLTGGSITSSASLSMSGDIYFGSLDNKFYSLNSSGSLNWSYNTNGAIHSSPAIDTTGRIYFGSNDKKLHSLNLDGTLVWSFATGGAVKSSPVIDYDGNIYFGSGDGFFYCIDANGNLNWKFDTEAPVYGNPSLTRVGNVIFGCDDGNIFSLSKDGELNWSYKTNNSVVAAPLITAEGRAYIGSSDNSIYGFLDLGPLSASYTHLWPTFQKDNKRTGSQIDIKTSIGDTKVADIPSSFNLFQNYPNPFNPTTRIQFHIAELSTVQLDIFNVNGEKIKTLLDERKQAGVYSIDWDGSNDRLQLVSSGIYLLKLNAVGSKNIFSKTMKMIKLK